MVVNAGAWARRVCVSRRHASIRETLSACDATSRKHRTRRRRPVTTGTGGMPTEAASETNVAMAATPPAYWLDASRLLNQSSTVPACNAAARVRRAIGQFA